MVKGATNLRTVLIISGIVIFIAGMGLGMLGQYQMNKSIMKSAEKSNNLIKNLSSSIVPSIVAYGQVKNFNATGLTLAYGGSEVDVQISKDIKIYSFVPSLDGLEQAPQKEASYADVKKGDYLNMAVKISPNGALVAQTAVILPAK